MYLILLFCLVSLSVLYLEAVKFRCDYKYNGLGWYKYYEMPTTWRDARLRCHLQGAVLASPTTQATKTIMIQSVGEIAMFTGFHSTFTPGDFYSIDGIPFETIPHKWEIGEPDNKDNAEGCIALNSQGYFSDVRCDKARPYMCYRENSSKDSNFCGTPDTEYYFEAKTNKCYKFHSNPRTFERAQFTCTAEGGHLVIINSEQESKVVQELFARHQAWKLLGNFWKAVAFVGFHNWGESADWMTVHGQTLQDAGYSKFSSGEPNNSTTGEYCGAVYRSGLYNDLWCERHYAFICEKKPDYPPVCDSESFIKELRSDPETNDITSNSV